jgi:predicted dienelactone hydrolase
MRSLFIGLCLSAAACVSAFAQATPSHSTQPPSTVTPGFQAWQGPTAQPTRPLTGGIWYPVASEGPSSPAFDSPIFQGTPVQRNAAMRPGRWPLVLLSHGIGGHWRSLSWLAADLAQQGAVVVGVNHPGSTFGDYDLRRSLNHGSRVKDLTYTLDALLADAAIGPHIDTQRIYVAGFSFGGWTALSMGGLRGDLQAYAQYCARSGHRHCRDISRAGIDLAQLDAVTWNRSYRDPRVTAVAAIDPGLHQGLDASHARDMAKRVLLIGLGQGADRLPDTDFSATGATLPGILPEARAEVMAPAFHFSALPVCKPAGPRLLAEDNDDPVCSDPPGTDRPTLHRRIARAIGLHFGLTLP